MSCLHATTFFISESRFLSNFPSKRSVLDKTKEVKIREINIQIILVVFTMFIFLILAGLEGFEPSTS